MDAHGLMLYEQLHAIPYLPVVIFEALHLGKERTSASPPAVYEEPEAFKLEHNLDFTTTTVTTDQAERKTKSLEKRKSGGGTEHLKQHIIPFSYGPRACPGHHLVEVEVYTAVANLARRYDFEEFETEPQAVVRGEGGGGVG
ncbi:MAG: hypothetical protein Q9210_007486 [Variospora velana]